MVLAACCITCSAQLVCKLPWCKVPVAILGPKYACPRLLLVTQDPVIIIMAPEQVLNTAPSSEIEITPISLQTLLQITYFTDMFVMLCRGAPLAAEALSSVNQYTKKVSDQLSDSLSSAWRRTSSHSRDLGDRLQGFKL